MTRNFERPAADCLAVDRRPERAQKLNQGLALTSGKSPVVERAGKPVVDFIEVDGMDSSSLSAAGRQQFSNSCDSIESLAMLV
jgi:hypothetical protein